MFNLILWIMIFVLMGKLIGFVSAKTEEVKQRTKRKH